jgi:hypothetical protein
MWKRLSNFAVVAALALSGCTVLLDYGLEGHVCGANGECQEGFACNAANICVKPSAAKCNPECGAFEECVHQQCVPTCKDRACPSGMECSDGTCQVLPTFEYQSKEFQLGARCTNDVDCKDATVPGLTKPFCLTPFGGHGVGVCSATCEDDTSCGGFAPACKAFRSEKGEGSLKLCVASAFTPCTLDGQCSASGLVCGVYETGTNAKTSNIRAASACRAPVGNWANPAKVGEQCQPGANPCINGLCIPVNSTGKYYCTQQCNPASADCSGLATPGNPVSCLQTTVGGRILDIEYPYVRAYMCVPGATTIGQGCESNPAVCNGEAPYCVKKNDASPAVCASRCTNGKDLSCPTDFTCVPSGVVADYCFPKEKG